MTRSLHLHADRLFPSDPAVRRIARDLYAQVRDLAIISPHGHTDPAWFAYNAPFENPVALLLDGCSTRIFSCNQQITDCFRMLSVFRLASSLPVRDPVTEERPNGRRN
jgi:hypothetical protein